MSVGYRAVQWSAHKRRYDLAAGLGVVLFLAAFIAVSKALHTGERAISDEVLAIRALGACALTMLHLILAIGPLARMFPAWLIVHANRRHLGVMTFFVALAHAALSIGYYHGFGALNPLVSLLTTTTRGSGIPFELLGLAALGVLFLLAATSHDFWLRNLGSAWWKALHMLVYFAYTLLVAHVVFGALASGRGLAPAILLAAGASALVTLHLCAARVSHTQDRPSAMSAASETLGWLDAGPASDLPLDRPRAVRGSQGERIAVVRHAGGISAVAGVCAHQGGPLDEGRVIDGCLTCPWHGWQYRPADGQSPPPFTERLTTHRVRVVSGRVLIDPMPLPPGTPVEPAGSVGVGLAAEAQP